MHRRIGYRYAYRLREVKSLIHIWGRVQSGAEWRSAARACWDHDIVIQAKVGRVPRVFITREYP